jgi:hypothetical protein
MHLAHSISTKLLPMTIVCPVNATGIDNRLSPAAAESRGGVEKGARRYHQKNEGRNRAETEGYRPMICQPAVLGLRLPLLLAYPKKIQ